MQTVLKIVFLALQKMTQNVQSHRVSLFISPDARNV